MPVFTYLNGNGTRKGPGFDRAIRGSRCRSFGPKTRSLSSTLPDTARLAIDPEMGRCHRRRHDGMPLWTEGDMYRSHMETLTGGTRLTATCRLSKESSARTRRLEFQSRA